MRILFGVLFLGIMGLMVGLTIVQLANSKKHSVVPQNGLVPDEQTAIQIAEAAWTPIYGKESIEAEKPFKARLVNNVWIVTGEKSKDFYGGEAVAEISKQDGRIIRISHGK